MRGRPRAGTVPEAVWINPPLKKKDETVLLIPQANCPERPKIIALENGMTEIRIEEIKGLEMAANLH